MMDALKELQDYMRFDGHNIPWKEADKIKLDIRLLTLANEIGVDRAIAILTAAQPLGDKAVPVLTEAGKVDKEAAASYVERLERFARNAAYKFMDDDWRVGMALRALISALPAKEQ